MHVYLDLKKSQITALRNAHRGKAATLSLSAKQVKEARNAKDSDNVRMPLTEAQKKALLKAQAAGKGAKLKFTAGAVKKATSGGFLNILIPLLIASAPGLAASGSTILEQFADGFHKLGVLLGFVKEDDPDTIKTDPKVIKEILEKATPDDVRKIMGGIFKGYSDKQIEETLASIESHLDEVAGKGMGSMFKQKYHSQSNKTDCACGLRQEDGKGLQNFGGSGLDNFGGSGVNGKGVQNFSNGDGLLNFGEGKTKRGRGRPKKAVTETVVKKKKDSPVS